MAQLTPRFLNEPSGARVHGTALPSGGSGLPQAQCRAGRAGRQICEWRADLERKWASLQFGALRVQSNADSHVFEVELFLADLAPEALRVELYADGLDGGEPVRMPMSAGQSPARNREPASIG